MLGVLTTFAMLTDVGLSLANRGLMNAKIFFVAGVILLLGVTRPLIDELIDIILLESLKIRLPRVIVFFMRFKVLLNSELELLLKETESL